LEQLFGAWADIYRKAGMIDFYRQALAWLFSYRFFEQPRSVAAMLRYFAAHPQPAEAFARQVAAGSNRDNSSRLSSLRVPTLVLAGEEDILVPPRLSHALVDLIPGAEWAVIPGAAHAISTEQGALFSRVVAEFLSAQSL
jgi:3-oxoadipate enol-lactonase